MNFPKIHLSRSADRKMNKKKTKQKKLQALNGRNYNGKAEGGGGGGRRILAVQYKIYPFF